MELLNIKKILIVALTITSMISCKKIYVETDFVSSNSDFVLTGVIKKNLVLTTGNVYTMNGLVYIESGFSITIQPGVIIQGAKGTNSSLIIKRGAKIFAEGSRTQPIVFTSSAPEGQKRIGDWGGVILLGKATNNGSYNGVPGVMEIEGGINNAQGDGLHGGNDDNDNSGIMKYVRIEFGGYPFQPDKEINGMTFGSVGRGTTIDYIQVLYINDDAFEWFGGTVNCKHLISYRNLDDDFDTDAGFRGNIQFAIAIRDTSIADATPGGASNGFESDNDGSGTSTAPFTAPVFSNVTLIGPLFTPTTNIAAPFRRGAHIRRNSRMSIFNSVIMGWPSAGAGILIDGAASENSAVNGDLEIRNTIIVGCPAPLKVNNSSSFNINNWFMDPARSNRILNSNTELLLNQPFEYTGFDPSPKSNSTLLNGASFSHSKLTGFQVVSYQGAVNVNDNWWSGWTRFINQL